MAFLAHWKTKKRLKFHSFLRSNRITNCVLVVLLLLLLLLQCVFLSLSWCGIHPKIISLYTCLNCMYCLHLARTTRLRPLSFSFHFTSMCMNRMWMYESFIDVFYIYFLSLYACVSYAQTWICFIYWTRPNIQNRFKPLFRLPSHQIRFFRFFS